MTYYLRKAAFNDNHQTMQFSLVSLFVLYLSITDLDFTTSLFGFPLTIDVLLSEKNERFVKDTPVLLTFSCKIFIVLL